MTHNLMARQDRHSLDKLYEMFMKKGRYLIENIATGKFLAPDLSLTSEEEAMSFETYGKCVTYCVEHHYSLPTGWRIADKTKENI